MEIRSLLLVAGAALAIASPAASAEKPAYDGKPGDKLYLPPGERVHIWN